MFIHSYKYYNIKIAGDSNSNFSADPVVSVSGTNVRSIALIGGFNGANGIFQINQVPGSNNIIENKFNNKHYYYY
ncbi:MAG: hypothetical protein DRP29_02015 [Thermodesulfobacteriota bacterium]|nr:MAG: hypothetical protein DRP29_02015 [Thermodesulfobacteriota bacterium]